MSCFTFLEFRVLASKAGARMRESWAPAEGAAPDPPALPLLPQGLGRGRHPAMSAVNARSLQCDSVASAMARGGYGNLPP